MAEATCATEFGTISREFYQDEQNDLTRRSDIGFTG